MATEYLNFPLKLLFKCRFLLRDNNKERDVPAIRRDPTYNALIVIVNSSHVVRVVAVHIQPQQQISDEIDRSDHRRLQLLPTTIYFQPYISRKKGTFLRIYLRRTLKCEYNLLFRMC